MVEHFGFGKELDTTERQSEILEELRNEGIKVAGDWALAHSCIKVGFSKAWGWHCYACYDECGMLESVLIGESLLYDPKDLARRLDNIARENLLDTAI